MSLVRRHVKPDDWRPTGIAELEPNALAVVRSTNHRSVIAGPGSGKTELLAQRASISPAVWRCAPTAIRES